MMAQQPGEPPNHDIRYRISDERAEEFLTRLADPNDELRTQLEEKPRETLLEWDIDIEGIPEKVTLPPADEVGDFIDNHLHRTRGETNNVGYAILYFMLGAMPFVVADRDGAD